MTTAAELLELADALNAIRGMWVVREHMGKIAKAEAALRDYASLVWKSGEDGTQLSRLHAVGIVDGAYDEQLFDLCRKDAYASIYLTVAKRLSAAATSGHESCPDSSHASHKGPE